MSDTTLVAPDGAACPSCGYDDPAHRTTSDEMPCPSCDTVWAAHQAERSAVYLAPVELAAVRPIETARTYAARKALR